MAENKIRFGVGFSEYIGARDNANIEIKDNKINGRAMFVLDAMDSSHLIFADKNGIIGVVSSEAEGVDIIGLTAVDKTRSYSEIKLSNVDVDVLEMTLSSLEAIEKSIDAERLLAWHNSFK